MDLNFNWKFADYPPKNGLKVFSTFACGGGSTMGYKLAGFDVIGANDIDPQMAKVYQANHKPKYFHNCPIGELLTKELPELQNLDILDGSPPCSTFSTAGARDKNWGKKKKFREGQAEQVLDDLFFDFLKLADKLKPKVIVAENVTGMLKGNAKGYCIMIMDELKKIGYKPQLFRLNAATMGVPQKRERVFFIASREDLNLPPLQLAFKKPPITFKELDEGNVPRRPVTSEYSLKLLKNVSATGVLNVRKKSTNYSLGAVGFGFCVLPWAVPLTITSGGQIFYWDKLHYITLKEMLCIGTFPQDYNFLNIDPQYLIGMSVPPLMVAKVANQIALQWFS